MMIAMNVNVSWFFVKVHPLFEFISFGILAP